MRFVPLLLAAALLLCAKPAVAREPVAGQRHPDLRLPTIDGERTLDLRDLRGKRVLLIEFASW